MYIFSYFFLSSSQKRDHHESRYCILKFYTLSAFFGVKLALRPELANAFTTSSMKEIEDEFMLSQARSLIRKHGSETSQLIQSKLAEVTEEKVWTRSLDQCLEDQSAKLVSKLTSEIDGAEDAEGVEDDRQHHSEGSSQGEPEVGASNDPTIENAGESGQRRKASSVTSAIESHQKKTSGKEQKSSRLKTTPKRRDVNEFIDDEAKEKNAISSRSSSEDEDQLGEYVDDDLSDKRSESCSESSSDSELTAREMRKLLQMQKLMNVFSKSKRSKPKRKKKRRAVVESGSDNDDAKGQSKRKGNRETECRDTKKSKKRDKSK